MPAVTSIDAQHSGEYAVLQLAWPGLPLRNVGVLLIDPESDRGWLRLTPEWDPQADPEVFPLLEEDLAGKLLELGAAGCLRWLQDTLSNVLRVTDSETVAVDSFTRVRDRLYRENVGALEVRPFTTHLPLYSLRAAATRFGPEAVLEEEPEDWVAAPEGLRLAEGMFVAHVVGRSMEPRIPNGSLNVFRAPVVGSRQGRIVLVKRPGGFAESAGCTIKRYTSVKRVTEEGWRHESIRLEPLNPEFAAFDLEPGDEVIAEWVRTLE